MISLTLQTTAVIPILFVGGGALAERPSSIMLRRALSMHCH